jgi:hypothetical protein
VLFGTIRLCSTFSSASSRTLQNSVPATEELFLRHHCVQKSTHNPITMVATTKCDSLTQRSRIKTSLKELATGPYYVPV